MKTGIDPSRPITRGNPPRNEGRFWKKGQSGNPKGRPSRPAASTILKTLLEASARYDPATLMKTKYGEDIFSKVTLKEVMLYALVAKAIKTGDHRACIKVLQLAGEYPCPIP